MCLPPPYNEGIATVNLDIRYTDKSLFFALLLKKSPAKKFRLQPQTTVHLHHVRVRCRLGVTPACQRVVAHLHCYICGFGSLVMSYAARKRRVLSFQDQPTILNAVSAGQKEELRRMVQYPS